MTKRRFPYPYNVVELLCPRCDSEYLHQGSVEVLHPTGRAYTVTNVLHGRISSHIVPDDEASSPSERGGLRIGFYCENCHGSSAPELEAEDIWLCIFNEKGCTKVGWIYETKDGGTATGKLVTYSPYFRPG